MTTTSTKVINTNTNNLDSFKPSPRPPFPLTGSTISNGKFFSLGKLGRGTFCEISKCVDLSHHHRLPLRKQQAGDDDGSGSKGNQSSTTSLRICAAKIELSTYLNSGVLDGEASVLKFLSDNMNNQTPLFCDYIKQSKSEKGVSAIIMEYLPGEDMHQLRDRHSQAAAKKAAASNAGGNDSNTSNTNLQPVSSQRCKRLKLEDAVYLCADVILPLLRSMHDCGMIHRDVKPSNLVRNGTDEDDTTFKLVDFGLSKSFVVPFNSAYADNKHPWNKRWHVPENVKNENGTKISGAMRKERPKAEFRGTSMYASLRVHQEYDHCRRDDIWGLMYVFCDLVSGGLPWAKYAYNRERSMCQRIKEWVHGERLTLDDTENNDKIDPNNRGDKKKVTNDHVEELLKGSEYHFSKYDRDMMSRKNEDKNMYNVKPLPTIASPLTMHQDEIKINALRNAFDHLAQLNYYDEPNYDLIRKCLKEFLKVDSVSESVKQENDIIPSINWKQPTQHEIGKRKWERIGNRNRGARGTKFTQTLSFIDTDDLDPHIQSTIDEAESLNKLNLAQLENASSLGNGVVTTNDYLDSPSYSEIEDLKRLPLQLQFYLAQVEYNAAHPSTIPMHLAFRDWMNIASTLVNDEWDTATYERGNHRSNDDGYRRQVLMRISQQCFNAAKPFNYFCKRDCFYYRGEDEEKGTKGRKRRKILVNDENKLVFGASSKSTFLTFSKVFLGLKTLIEKEKERLTAPPPLLSISGDGRNM